MLLDKIYFIVLTCLITAVSLSNDIHLSDLESKTEVYKVIIPKSGFIGGPASAAAWMPVNKPTKKEDFDEYFLKIIIIDERVHDSVKRKVIRIDQINKEDILLHKGIYFAYADITPSGSRIVCRYSDDNGDVTESGVVRGIPFPFACTKPFCVKSDLIQSGYVDSRIGFGSKFIKSINSTNNLVMVNSTFFRKSGKKNVDRELHWHKSEIGEIANETVAKTLFTENQKWSKENDLLWEEMERFDKDGNILMKCQRIELPAKETEEAPVEE